MFTLFCSKPAYQAGIAAGFLLIASSNAQALLINANFDASVSLQEQAAFNYAAQQIDGLISNNLNFTIDVTTMSSGLAQSAYSVYPVSYRNVLRPAINSALVNQGITSGLLPSTSPAPAGSSYAITTADAYALGYLRQFGNSSANIGTISFNANLSYATDPNQRAVAGAYDLIGVLEHEISELLGRISGLTNANPFIAPMDLFRYTASNQQVFTNVAGSYFSLNDGVTALQYFNSVAGQDIQDWNSDGSNPLYNAADSFNAAVQSNQMISISSADILSLRAVGYTVIPLPASIWLFTSACLAWMGLGWKKLHIETRRALP